MSNPVKKVPIHLQSAQNRLLIKGGNVVNDDGVEQVDVYVEDFKIKQMGNHLIIPGGTRVIDASGKYVIPGGIDMNVHLQMPTKKTDVNTETIDNFYQGTKAAIAGGTTMIVDTVVPEDNEPMDEAIAKWRGWAEDRACCDYSFAVALPSKVTNQVLTEMEMMAESGVNTFRIEMIGDRKMDDANLVKALTKIAKLECMAQIHAESGEIVDRNVKRILDKGITGPEGLALAHTEAAEEDAVLRVTTLANQINCPIQINHCMSAKAAEVIKYKKARGSVVFGEVTPAAIACDGEEYWNKIWRHAAGFTCAPPLRKGQKAKLLDDAVDSESGKAFDIISSHHATYNAKQKALGIKDFTNIPLGVNGVESRLSVLWELAVHSGKMTPQQFVAMTSSVPAKMLNVYPDKGRLEVGNHADIVVWDPTATRTITKDDHNLKVDFNIFEGMVCHGIADTVVVQGKLMVDEGRVRVMQGFGNCISLAPNASFVYGKVRAKIENELDLAAVQPVARSDEDMVIPATNGRAKESGDNQDEDDIPPPTPKKSEQAERAPSQQSSNFDLRSHPNAPDELDEQYRSSPQRASVRVRAPPGGRSSGGFW